MGQYKIDRAVAIAKDKLHPNPWNPNGMEAREQQAVGESVESYGQVLDLLVRPHPEVKGEYQIIDGEHRYNVLPETVYCTIIYDLPDAEAKKLTIIMNETRGSADKIDLAKLLKDISEDLGDDLGLALPYKPGELEEMLSLSEVDWDEFNADAPPPSDPPGDEPAEPVEPNDGEPPEDEPYSDNLMRIVAALPPGDMDVLKQARALIEDDPSIKLPEEFQQSWGQVCVALARFYINQP